MTWSGGWGSRGIPDSPRSCRNASFLPLAQRLRQALPQGMEDVYKITRGRRRHGAGAETKDDKHSGQTSSAGGALPGFSPPCVAVAAEAPGAPPPAPGSSVRTLLNTGAVTAATLSGSSRGVWAARQQLHRGSPPLDRFRGGCGTEFVAGGARVLAGISLAREASSQQGSAVPSSASVEYLRCKASRTWR
uniref:Uncharacterized protein n=1 Tax=Rhizochromulina marina TaxID=1034831 RepID=A0A7S2WA67_9STRA